MDAIQSIYFFEVRNVAYQIWDLLQTLSAQQIACVGLTL